MTARLSNVKGNKTKQKIKITITEREERQKGK